jgi:predicted nuclease of restriction endonuclease-like (RecB) superfamily
MASDTKDKSLQKALPKRPSIQLPAGYSVFLEELKDQIRVARVRASLSVNRQMIELYLQVGQRISEQQTHEGWGMSVVERLSRDLRREFPDLRGFSPRNMWDMRRLYESVREHPLLRQLVAEIPWGHNLVLLNGVKNPDKRQWYIRQVIQHGWSRSILILLPKQFMRPVAVVKHGQISFVIPKRWARKFQTPSADYAQNSYPR